MNKKRKWIMSQMEEAFKANVTERDYQIVTGMQRLYNPVFTGAPGETDVFLINIAYQIGKAEGRKGR